MHSNGRSAHLPYAGVHSPAHEFDPPDSLRSNERQCAGSCASSMKHMGNHPEREDLVQAVDKLLYLDTPQAGRRGLARGQRTHIALCMRLDIACSHGSDEFRAALPGTELPGATKFAQCLVDRLQSSPYTIAMDVGLIQARPDHWSETNAMIKQADQRTCTRPRFKIAACGWFPRSWPRTRNFQASKYGE